MGTSLNHRQALRQKAAPESIDRALSGAALTASAHLIDGRIEVAIRIAADRALVARVLVALPPATSIVEFQPETAHPLQPCYPV